MQNNKKKVPAMLETLAKLVNADKLTIAYTECVFTQSFIMEFDSDDILECMYMKMQIRVAPPAKHIDVWN